jgi:hypothetical protein
MNTPPTNRGRSTRLTIAVLAMVAFVACGGNEDTAESTIAGTTNAPDTTAPTPTAPTDTTPVTEPTTTSTSSPPDTVTITTPPPVGGPAENEDWSAILQGLLTTRHELFASPDPTRAGEVYDLFSPRYPLFEDNLRNLQANGERTVDQDPQEVRSLEVSSLVPVNEQGQEIANIRAVIYRGPNNGRIVNAAGETVFDLVTEESLPPDGLSTIVFNLVRSNGGPWRILGQVSA